MWSVDVRPAAGPNAAKRHYRYYACARRVESRSCAQPYIPAARLEGAVIGKIQELATRPELIRPFLARETKRRKAASRERTRRARGLERRIADLEARQGQLVDWLAETLPGKAAARKLNEKIEPLEEEKRKLAAERAGIEDRSTEDLDVTAETVAGHLAGFGYLPRSVQPGAAQRAPGGRGAGGHGRGAGPHSAKARSADPTVGAVRPAGFKMVSGMATPTGRRPERDSGRICDRP
ncbi:MAG TPA: zinc ribbon domain-containing protein [Thermoanaerobaculia bacterium]|nr:zinc ribbon domain-containing protein [Thermoanaerobaculia bacterium]